MKKSISAKSRIENSQTVGQKTSDRLRRLVVLSLFAAVSYLSMYIVNFKVEFLTFDIKNVFMVIPAMIFGPVAGIVIALVVSVIEFLLISTTGFYGLVMNFISSASFAALPALVYRFKRSQRGSYLALLVGTFGSTAMMLLANLVITPFYMGVGVADVAAMLPRLLFPFNLIKCLVNAALVLILYKPISVILKRSGILRGREEGKETARYRFDLPTVMTILAALVIIGISLLIFFFVLDGKIHFGSWTEKSANLIAIFLPMW